MRRVADLVVTVVRVVVLPHTRPSAADVPRPEGLVDIGGAILAAGREAGGFCVEVAEAEVFEDEGAVVVLVVVFELKVVAFADDAGDSGLGGAAVAVCAEEVVAVEVGDAVGAAGEFANFGLDGGDRVDEDRVKGEEGKEQVLERSHAEFDGSVLGPRKIVEGRICRKCSFSYRC